MSKQDIVAALKDTCLMLDERKAKFELMISALEREDVDVDGEDGEDESEKEVKDDASSDNENEEDDNKGDDEASGRSSEAAE